MVKMIDRLEEAGLAHRELRRDHHRRGDRNPDRHGTGGPPRRGHADRTAHNQERERLTELLSALLPTDAKPPVSLTAHIGYLVAINHIRLRERGRLGMRSLGMEPRYFGMLTTLAAIEPCSQQRLAAELHITGPAIVGIIEQLHRTGRIERQRNPDDRRAHVLRLTAKGRADLAEAKRIVDEIHDGLAERLGRDGMDELNTLLTKILR
jgi:DNA-binding MarR family transcriptional regulator